MQNGTCCFVSHNLPIYYRVYPKRQPLVLMEVLGLDHMVNVPWLEGKIIGESFPAYRMPVNMDLMNL